MKVKCNWCEWTGDEEELILPYDIGDERCPNCNRGDCLIDLEEENDEHPL